MEKTYKKWVFGILNSNLASILSKIPVSVRYYYTKNVSRIFFYENDRGMDYFWEKLVFHKSSLLMTPYYDVTISGKECSIKLEWVVQLR